MAYGCHILIIYPDILLRQVGTFFDYTQNHDWTCTAGTVQIHVVSLYHTPVCDRRHHDPPTSAKILLYRNHYRITEACDIRLRTLSCSSFASIHFWTLHIIICILTMGLNQPVLHASNSIRSFGDTAGSTNKTCTDVMGAIVSAKLALRSKASFQNTKTVGHHLPQQRCDYGHCQSFDALRQASPPQGKPTRYRANAGNLFPSRLHSMLNSAESEQFAHIVSWQPHGRCFKVHQPLRFATEVMPLWFHHTKFTSFRRQLNLYGFSRLTTGVDYGG
jgi:hypothetical protein